MPDANLTRGTLDRGLEIPTRRHIDSPPHSSGQVHAAGQTIEQLRDLA